MLWFWQRIGFTSVTTIRCIFGLLCFPYQAIVGISNIKSRTSSLSQLLWNIWFVSRLYQISKHQKTKMWVIRSGKNTSSVPSWETEDFSGPLTLIAAAVNPSCWPFCFILILGKWVMTHFLWSWCFCWAGRCRSLPGEYVCTCDVWSCLSLRNFLPWILR